MLDKDALALNYLRHRRAMIAEELSYIRARIASGHDPDEADDQIVRALAAELCEVSDLIRVFDGRVLH